MTMDPDESVSDEEVRRMQERWQAYRREHCSRGRCGRPATQAQACPESECAARGLRYCDEHAPEHAAWHAARHESALAGTDGDAAVDALPAAWEYWRIEDRFPDLLDRAYSRDWILRDVMDLLSQKVVRDLAAVDRRRAEGRGDPDDARVERDCELLVCALDWLESQ